MSQFDPDKVYNKIILGQNVAGETMETVIDMTVSGDKPSEKEGGHPVQKIEDVTVQSNKNVILSKTVTGGDNDNEAWSSSGHLITGTCTFNADVSVDTISAPDVIETLTFHQGSSMPEQTKGTMPNYRGVEGSEEAASGTKARDVVIQPMTTTAEAWENANFIATGEGNDAGIGSTKIPSGAYGKNQADAMTKIKVAGIDYSLISNTTYLFGVQGTLHHNIQPNKNVPNPKLNEFVVTPDETYDGMAQVTVGDTPIVATENPGGSGSYTCYIGSWHN